MSDTQIHIVAIIYPKAEKFQRAKQLLTELGAKVKANEPGTIRYEILEELNVVEGGVPALIVDELYENQAAIEAHKETEHFKVFFKAVSSERLLAGPSTMKVATPFAGFSSKL